MTPRLLQLYENVQAQLWIFFVWSSGPESALAASLARRLQGDGQFPQVAWLVALARLRLRDDDFFSQNPKAIIRRIRVSRRFMVVDLAFVNSRRDVFRVKNIGRFELQNIANFGDLARASLR